MNKENIELKHRMDDNVNSLSDYHDALNEDIKAFEQFRTSYNNNKSLFKCLGAISFLSSVNKVTQGVANAQKMLLITKILAPIIIFIFTYFVNTALVSAGYTTGVNGFIIVAFAIGTFFTTFKFHNQAMSKVLEECQLNMRQEKFNLMS